MRAIDQLIDEASRLHASGEIGDGKVAQFNTLAARARVEASTPIPMVLHCPRCGVQHIDEATAEWDNPPHRSHACQANGCGCIWRPADVATAGVAAITTGGKSDNWAPGDTTLRDRFDPSPWRGDRLPDGAGARGLG